MIAPRDTVDRSESGRLAVPVGSGVGWTPSLFRRRAVQEPDRVAVEGPSGSLTYAELDRVTDRQAKALRRQGVRRGMLVGLAFPRSVEAISAMLAVMKAGGAFLPIDPDYPTARQAFMLKDAGISVVVSTPEVAPTLPVSGAQVVTLDELDGLNIPSTFDLPSGQPGDLAYAIYTSGSTGRPKAALLTHRGIGPLGEAQATAFAIVPGTRVLQFASLGFDAMISEVFVTLIAGGTICVASASELVPGERLAQTLRRRRIAVATMPPSVVAMLPPGGYPDLRTLVVAGEACPASLASQWSVGRRLVNAYGPTEATVCASLFLCPEGQQPAPPIGTPLPHIDCLVLDGSGDPVPDGTPGELYLGGPALAEGYLRRPELTSERFVSHPGGAFPPEKLYRTGDRVRRREDGNLEFLGRIDEQVKIRGIRIEPSEIREAIEGHPFVRSAAIVPEGDGEGRRLAAFVVPEDRGRLSIAELRNHLRTTLPIHLMPGRMSIVDRLPLTAHGKLDQRALLKLEPERSTPSSIRARHALATPRDALELQVAEVWSELFGREVGIHDDFFELGGDSLSAMDLLARVDRRCGVALPVASMLASPTVAGMAAALGEQRGPGHWSPVVPIQAGGDRPPLFCVHPGGGNVLCYVELARALGPDQPFYGLQAPGVDDGRLPLTSVDAMAETYLQAIRRVQPEGAIRLCGWSFGGVIAFEMARRLAEAGSPPDRLILIDAGFLHSFAILRALIPSEKPLFQFLGANREAIFPEFCHHAEASKILPSNASDPQVRRIFDVFMANVEALYTYRPEPYSAGRITLLMAEEPIADRRRDPLDEWRLLSDDLEVLAVPGNHLSMLMPPHVDVLARALWDRLDHRPTGAIPGQHAHPSRTDT